MLFLTDSVNTHTQVKVTIVVIQIVLPFWIALSADDAAKKIKIALEKIKNKKACRGKLYT